MMGNQTKKKKPTTLNKTWWMLYKFRLKHRLFLLKKSLVNSWAQELLKPLTKKDNDGLSPSFLITNTGFTFPHHVDCFFFFFINLKSVGKDLQEKNQKKTTHIVKHLFFLHWKEKNNYLEIGVAIWMVCGISVCLSEKKIEVNTFLEIVTIMKVDVIWQAPHFLCHFSEWSRA